MRPILLALICLVLLGCNNNDSAQKTSANANANAKSESETSWLSATGIVPSYSQRPGDATRGRKALLNESYVNCGLPERVFRQLQTAGNTEVNPIARDGSMEGLPFSTNRVIGTTGIPVVSSNCLSCHGTTLFGELVIGLGNEFADFTQNPSALVERAGALVQGANEVAEWERFADRIAAISPYIQMETVGVNPAKNLTFALIAHRDVDTHAWLPEAQLPLPSTQPPPISVPPWWRMSKKHALFNLAEAREDHARMMLAASMLCADSVEELNEIDEYAPDIRAYLASLKPPSYPFAIDQALADQGKVEYERLCADCHGSYAGGVAYPNRVIPIEDINTDPEVMLSSIDERGKRYANWFNQSWFGQRSLAAPARGYIAPPLDGIWATAPYLHNGSVPTLAALLEPSTRPKIWRHLVSNANDPESYNTQELGWNHERLEAGSYDLNDTRVYDTNRLGYGNSGHPMGEELSPALRMALLEYLKTL